MYIILSVRHILPAFPVVAPASDIRKRGCGLLPVPHEAYRALPLLFQIGLRHESGGAFGVCLSRLMGLEPLTGVSARGVSVGSVMGGGVAWVWFAWVFVAAMLPVGKMESYALVRCSPTFRGRSCWASQEQEKDQEHEKEQEHDEVYEHEEDQDPSLFGRSLEVSARIPTHTAAGDPATLHCDYKPRKEARIYSVKWYKDEGEFYRYQPWSNPPSQVFYQPGIKVDLQASNDRAVVLKSVNLSTSGNYKCEVSMEAPSFDTVSFSGDMLVVVVPDQRPQIKGGRDHYRLNDRVHLNCTSGPSKPAASLMWYINDEQADPKHLREYPPFPVHNDLEEAVLGLDFRVKPHHFPPPDRILRMRCTATVATLYWESHELKPISEPSPNDITVLSSLGGNRSSSVTLMTWLRILLLLMSFVANILFS
ncbi:unnamed protein product [Darwinula stevensoni]|uniref:Ig-like domain-containing protein n=1 Tax=Darwinula stevensoni TaxID=69355 RepID=A0A7R8ZXX6_9CRUS|nr:unnamed protein product [Darwinula stevensoni]CAG0880330.1 unnamed protein product [Darwinula stevensoni]